VRDLRPRLSLALGSLCTLACCSPRWFACRPASQARERGLDRPASRHAAYRAETAAIISRLPGLGLAPLSRIHLLACGWPGSRKHQSQHSLSPRLAPKLDPSSTSGPGWVRAPTARARGTAVRQQGDLAQTFAERALGQAGLQPPSMPEAAGRKRQGPEAVPGNRLDQSSKERTRGWILSDRIHPTWPVLSIDLVVHRSVVHPIERRAGPFTAIPSPASCQARPSRRSGRPGWFRLRRLHRPLAFNIPVLAEQTMVHAIDLIRLRPAVPSPVGLCPTRRPLGVTSWWPM